MPYNIYFIFVYLIFMSVIVLYSLHSTSVLSFYIDVVLTLSMVECAVFLRHTYIKGHKPCIFFLFPYFYTNILTVIGDFICLTLNLRQDGCHFYLQFRHWKWISIKIALKFVPGGQIDNNSALVQVCAESWYRVTISLFINFRVGGFSPIRNVNARPFNSHSHLKLYYIWKRYP